MSDKMGTTPKDADVLDVAIVGAGASGAYTAYRLGREWQKSPVLKSQVDEAGRSAPQIEVFDINNRIGGRLYSYTFRESDNLVAELGGQGFSSLMRNVYCLAKEELDLDVVPCPSFNTPLFQYLRGSRVEPADFGDPENFLSRDTAKVGDVPIRYFVRPDERTDPTSLLVDRFLERVPAAKAAFEEVKKALESKTKESVVNALPMMTALWNVLRYANIQSTTRPQQYATLHEFGYWNWMMEEFGSEAYKLNLDSSFSTSFDGNYNLYDIIVGFFSVYFAYFTDVPFWAVGDGYDRVPKTMLERFQQDGGKLSLESRLLEVGKVQSGDETLISLTIEHNRGKPQTIFAKNVVLALPKLALSRLAVRSSILDNHTFLSLLNSVHATSASKLFLLYMDAWWKDAMPKGTEPPLGYATTDLPLRACYYVGTDEKANRALLLSSLSDAAFSMFWNGFLDDDAWGPYVHSNTNLHDVLEAPDAMIEEMSMQLNEMHYGPGANKVPAPIDQVFQDWMRFPYEGGWHLWHPKVKSWDVMPKIRRPVDGLNLYTCGEAYSTLQGWVEGAVNTAERTLQDHFGMPRASWIDDAYDLGP